MNATIDRTVWPAWAALALASAWTTFLVVKYGIDLPYKDGWEWFFWYEKLKTGSFSFQLLFIPHNEHRLVLPLALMMLNTVTLDWNIKATLVLNVALATGTAAMLIWLASRTLSASRVALIVLGVLIVVQIFNMSQWVNWLWEFEVQWFLSNFFSVLTACFLYVATQRHSPALVWSALVAACAASLSMSAGLLTLPLGLIYLLIAPLPKRYALAWAVVGAAIVGLYLWGLPPSTAPSPPGHIARITAAVEFVFRFVGSTLGQGQIWGAGLIVAGALSALLCLGDPRQRLASLPWIFLAGYGAGAAIVAGHARAHWFGAIGGGNSRYSTISCLFVIAVAALVLQASQHWPRTRLAVTSVCAALIAVSLWQYPRGYRHFASLHHSIVTARECLISNSPDDTCIGRLYPIEHAASVRERWKKLGDLGWRSFARKQ